MAKSKETDLNAPYYIGGYLLLEVERKIDEKVMVAFYMIPAKREGFFNQNPDALNTSVDAKALFEAEESIYIEKQEYYDKIVNEIFDSLVMHLMGALPSDSGNEIG